MQSKNSDRWGELHGVTDRRPWWLKFGAERPVRLEAGCGESTCDVAEILPVDIYCNTQDRLLRFPGAPESKQRLVVSLLGAAAICSTFVLAAESGNPLPVFLALGALAGAASILPLRRYPTTWRVTALLSALTFVGAIVAYESETPAHRVMGSLLVGSCAIAWWLMFGHVALRGGWAGRIGGAEPTDAELVELAAADEDDWSAPDLFGRADSAGSSDEDDSGSAEGGDANARLEPWAGAVVSLAGSVPVALALAASFTFGPVSWIARASATASMWLLVIAVGGALAALLIAVIAGAIEHGKINDSVDPVGAKPGLDLGPSWKKPQPLTRPRPTGAIDRIAAIVPKLAYRLDNGVRRVLHATKRVGRRVAFRVLLAKYFLVNWVKRLFVLAYRQLAASLRTTGTVVLRAALLAAPSAVRATRVIVLPVSALCGVAALLLLAAQADRTYLVDGSLADLGVTVGTAAAAAVLAGLVWVALCGLPVGMVSAASTHTWTVSSANGLALLAIGGWVVGLPGTLGYGRIHVGWVTIGATMLLVGTSYATRDRKRGRVDVPAAPEAIDLAAAEAKMQAVSEPQACTHDESMRDRAKFCGECGAVLVGDPLR